MHMISRRVLTFLFSLALNIPSLGHAQATLQYTPDVPQEFQKYLNQSLADLFQIQGVGSTPLHRQIFKGDVNGGVYKHWLLSRVKKIAITDNCHLTAKIDSTGEVGVIYISKCADLTPRAEKNFFWLSIIFHEARHLEPEAKYWKHGVCADASGMAEACDNSELAPFALEKVFSANLIRFCQNCPPSMIEQAREVLEDPITWRKILPKALDSIDQDLSSK